MTKIQTLPPKKASEIHKETFMSRLPQQDRDNLQMFVSMFDQALRSTGRRGVLAAVGGAVNKPLPRPDIDISVILDHTSDPGILYETSFVYAKKDFDQNFRPIIESIVSASGSPYTVTEVVAPYPDRDIEDYPANDGSIKLQGPPGTTLLEVIRHPKRMMPQEIPANMSGPFSILSRV